MADPASRLTITPIHPHLGARVEGVDLAQPLDPPIFQRVAGAFQEHSGQALIRANPVNGRRSIFIGSHAWYIEGLPYDESRRLLDDLLAHATRPECVYQHRWRQWDLVMWDNRCVLHRGRPWDAAVHRRVMRRTTVAGEGPTADPPFAARTPAWDGIIPEGVGV